MVLTTGREGSIRNGAAFFIDDQLKWRARRLNRKNNSTRNNGSETAIFLIFTGNVFDQFVLFTYKATPFDHGQT